MTSDPPPKQDDLDAVLGPYLERARAAAPKITPLTDNPELAKAIADAAALSVDGNPFGPLAPDPHEVVPAAPESERVEQASAPLAPMRQHTQPLERVRLKGHTTIKGRAVAPVARLPGEPEEIEPPGLTEPTELPERERRSPIALGIGAGIVVLLLGGWWLFSRSTAQTGSMQPNLVVAPKSTEPVAAPTQTPAPDPPSTQVAPTAAATAAPKATTAPPPTTRPAKKAQPSSTVRTGPPSSTTSAPLPSPSPPPTSTSDRFQD